MSGSVSRALVFNRSVLSLTDVLLVSKPREAKNLPHRGVKIDQQKESDQVPLARYMQLLPDDRLR